MCIHEPPAYWFSHLVTVSVREGSEARSAYRVIDLEITTGTQRPHVPQSNQYSQGSTSQKTALQSH